MTLIPNDERKTLLLTGNGAEIHINGGQRRAACVRRREPPQTCHHLRLAVHLGKAALGVRLD